MPEDPKGVFETGQEIASEVTGGLLVLCNFSFQVSLSHSGDSTSLALARLKTAT
jgi:hypothetical protein